MLTHRLLMALAAAAASTNNFAARAEESPTYNGFARKWQATFPGSAGTLINEANWNIITGTGQNNEVETYTRNTANLQLSGGDTLQLIPLRDSSVSGGWTSGRVESHYTFTPPDGKITRAEAKIRFGGNPQSVKQGIWPAFWTLGQSLREGTPWPQCGELDVLETVNGIATGYGTAHCGAPCNEPSGLGASTSVPDNGWHVWRIQWNREPAAWTDELVTWWRDGVKFHTITGAQIGDEATWNALCHSPLYFILNVAVGGDWPGAPNANTVGGTGSMMEIAYVSQYVST